MIARLSSAIIILGLAEGALAIQPGEVLVVANGSVQASVDLANHYAQARQIPAENVLTVQTTDGYSIARPAYEQEIVEPIRRHLATRGSQTPIRCICLMWGMPVRVENVQQIPPPELARFYATEQIRQRQRLGTDRELIARIGRQFPQPQTPGLEPLSQVFSGVSLGPSQDPATLSYLQENIPVELAQAILRVEALTDPQELQVAQRQVLAIQLELYGLTGLTAYIDEHRPDLAQDKSGYRQQLGEHLTAARAQLTELGDPQTPDENRVLLAWMQRADGAMAVAAHAVGKNAQLTPNRGTQADASVDSELAMIARVGGYDLNGPQFNSLHYQISPNDRARLYPTIMTCRIDGPSPADARRIIDDSLAVEQVGLRGTFYVDAGLPDRFQNKPGGYIAFDERLRRLADTTQKSTPVPVVKDLDPTVFPRGSCDNAALYVGWYSLQSYVPAFTWVRGAVGYHIASFEAMHLRDPDSNEWVPKMIQNGVSATVGAVNEPGLDAFPDPPGFFLLLMTGQYTVAECYWRTVPHASWQMTLVCDPLYTPLKVNPAVQAAALQGLLPTGDWPSAYAPPPTTQPAEATTQPGQATTLAATDPAPPR